MVVAEASKRRDIGRLLTERAKNTSEDQVLRHWQGGRYGHFATVRAEPCSWSKSSTSLSALAETDLAWPFTREGLEAPVRTVTLVELRWLVGLQLARGWTALDFLAGMTDLAVPILLKTVPERTEEEAAVEVGLPPARNPLTGPSVTCQNSFG